MLGIELKGLNIWAAATSLSYIPSSLSAFLITKDISSLYKMRKEEISNQSKSPRGDPKQTILHTYKLYFSKMQICIQKNVMSLFSLKRLLKDIVPKQCTMTAINIVFMFMYYE